MTLTSEQVRTVQGIVTKNDLDQSEIEEVVRMYILARKGVMIPKIKLRTSDFQSHIFHDPTFIVDFSKFQHAYDVVANWFMDSENDKLWKS